MSGLVVNTNLSALQANYALGNTTSALQSSLLKLSTGMKINSAADDASGLAISQSMTAQINGLNAATQNAQDGVSVLQTAEGGLNTAQTILQRINTLAVRAGNDGTLTTTDKNLMQSEVNQLTAELDRMASTVSFNGKSLLDGSYTGQTLQVGEGAGTQNQLTVDVAGVSTSALGLSGIDIVNSATNAISLVGSAIDSISANRGAIGATINRLNYSVQNLGIEVQNATASVSNIMDTNMATEMSNFTKLQVLQQAGTAMLAQANQAPQAVLKLV
jgi:flagellin